MNNHTFIIAGNCVFHCLRDQLRTVLHMDVPSDPFEFRLKVILSIQHNRHLMNHSDLTVDQWIAKNCINKIHVSHLALQLVANLYKIKIIVYQLFHEDGLTHHSSIHQVLFTVISTNVPFPLVFTKISQYLQLVIIIPKSEK